MHTLVLETQAAAQIAESAANSFGDLLERLRRPRPRQLEFPEVLAADTDATNGRDRGALIAVSIHGHAECADVGCTVCHFFPDSLGELLLDDSLGGLLLDEITNW